jgi:hypothetical protein
MNNLHDVLEICLNEIEQGSDVDTVLFRYPDHADELRPILEASVKAKNMAAPAPSQDVMKRSRAKLLQRAAEMREGRVQPASRRIWSVPLRRALVTLMVVVMLFVSGTGLVRAASTTLPGDNLYPVKRTWEDMLLLFTFDMQKRETLELEHENERLEELNELFAMGRSAKVDFAGYVTRQAGTEWRVSGITVVVSAQTRMPEEQITLGAPVRVRGQTQGNGIVIAERIDLLSPNANLPEVEDHDVEIEQENSGNSNQQREDNSGKGSDNEAPRIESTKTPKAESKPKQVTLEGVVSSIENKFVVVNGVLSDVSLAEVKGTPGVGAIAKMEGYFDSSGIFIVTKIEYRAGTSGTGSGSGSKNANDNDDDSNNDNDEDDSNNNDNDSNGNGGDD